MVQLLRRNDALEVVDAETAKMRLWWLHDKSCEALERLGLYPILFGGRIWYRLDRIEKLLNER